MATVITNTDIGANLGFSGSPLKLVASEQLRGNNYIVVYGKNNTPQQNGFELISKYNFAKTTMPNGQPLSPSNRFTILVAPGVYSFTSIIAPSLDLDTPYIDIISLSGEADVFIDTLFSSTPIIVTTSDIKLVGLNVGGQALAIEGQYAETYYKNIIGGDYCFSSQNNGTKTSGNFENCRGGVGSFGNANNAGHLWYASFKNCSGSFYCFGEKNYYSNFENCQASHFSFGTVEIVGSNFINCTSFGGNCFGSTSNISNVSSVDSSSFYKCTSGDYSFGVILQNSTLEYCKAGVESFGADIANSTFRNCTAGNSSFGAGLQGWSTLQAGGKFYNCVAGEYSFGKEYANGEFYHCVCNNNGGWIGNTQSGMGGYAFSCKGMNPIGPGTAVYCIDAGGNPVNFGLATTTNNI